MKFNQLQFAVVREDPEIECELIRGNPKIKKILMIGSGGCTAFTVRHLNPNIEQTLVEPNLAQINLIKIKEKLLTENKIEELKILNQTGNFESLFRSFRLFIEEFIVDHNILKKNIMSKQQEGLKKIFSHPYWPVAFDLFFSDKVLNVMFGPDSTQHAPKNSYPGYFKNVFEKGLVRSDLSENYFIHHVFLGEYLPTALPTHFGPPPANCKEFEIKNCLLHEVDDFSLYDFMTFSNIFDWCSEDYIQLIAKRLKTEARENAMIVFRQLNHQKDFTTIFSPHFKFHSDEENRLLGLDRSLFYSKLNIATKVQI